MPLTPAQKVDIEQTIMVVIDRLLIDPQKKKEDREKDRQALINYLLDPSEKNRKNLSYEAREGFEELLEDRLLDANMWLNNPIFMGKSNKAEAPPTAQEITTLINKKLLSQKTDKLPSQEEPKNSCTQQLLKEGKEKDQPQAIDNALLDAAYQGDQKAIQQALEGGLDINKTYPPYGGTLLSYAVVGGSLDLVNFLLQQGAEPNVVDKNNNLPLAWAILKSKPEGIESRSAAFIEPVLSPAQSNYINIAKTLLEAGSRVDVQDNSKRKQTPLDLIKEDKNAEIVALRKEMQKNVVARVDQIEQALNSLDKSQINFPQIIAQLRLVDLTVPQNAELLKIATEIAIKQRNFDVAKTLLNIPHNNLLEKSSDDKYNSILTFTLEQAFQSRYTQIYREAFLDFSKYLLINGAKASKHDGEILENFYPHIPYDVLKLTDLESKFSDFEVSSVTKYDAEQAALKLNKDLKLDKTTGLWEVVFENNSFVLQHTQHIHPMEVDDRVGKIVKQYGEHGLGIETKSVGMGMGTKKVTLTIPTAVIPQINQNNFSRLLTAEQKQKALTEELANKGERERIRQKQIRDTKKELNLLRTKDIAKKTYNHLNQLMPGQWKMIPAQNGYELHYNIGFKEERDQFEKKDGLKETMKNMLGVDLKPEEYILGRGTHAWELVLRASDMKNIPIVSQAQSNTSQNERDERIKAIWEIKETQDPDTRPNLYEVSKLLAANPKDINKQFAYKGASPLSLAVTDGDIDAVKAFLDLKANPNLQDNRGNTPLAWAILKASGESQDKQEKYRQIALLLVQSGAKLDIPDKDNWTPKGLINYYGLPWEADILSVQKSVKDLNIKEEAVEKKEESISVESDITKLSIQDTVEKLTFPDTFPDGAKTRLNELKDTVNKSIRELETSNKSDEQIDRITRVVIGMEAVVGQLSTIDFDDPEQVQKFKETALADFSSEVVFSSPAEKKFIDLLLWIEKNIIPESLKIAPEDADKADSKFRFFSRFFKPLGEDVVKQKAFDLSEDIEEITKGPRPGSGQ